jgi:hypothetical protein
MLVPGVLASAAADLVERRAGVPPAALKVDAKSGCLAFADAFPGAFAGAFAVVAALAALVPAGTLGFGAPATAGED